MVVKYKLEHLIKKLQYKGIFFVLKRVVPFFFNSFIQFLRRSYLVTEILNGTFPQAKNKLFRQRKVEKIELSKTKLVEAVRYFWYGNLPGEFALDGEKIKRAEVFTYGGPNPELTCEYCQRIEWLSRVRQKNLFDYSHQCPEAHYVQSLCEKQGSDLWTYYHQNFAFSIGCNTKIPAPKCLYVTFDPTDTLLTPRPALGDLIFRRKIALAHQVDVVVEPIGIDWHNYDFLYIYLSPSVKKFSKPELPIVLYCHDFWPLEDKVYQWAIDWLKPEVILTSYPAQWKKYFKIPSGTRVVFSPLFESLFFNRPNLGEKTLDLLVIGAVSSTIYKPRVELAEQIAKLSESYKIEFSHVPGHIALDWQGPTFAKLKDGTSVRFLNKWSEYLGSAKYVVFGRMKWPILTGKHYESLGSGAIPIFPETPDLKYLHVKPFEHYIPLSEVEGNNEKLKYFLDNYEKYKYIAKNAVKWYKENSDRMIFSDFEDLIREITGYKYPKRLIE